MGVAIVLTILKQLQPYLSANNLSTVMTIPQYASPMAGKHQRGGSYILGQNTAVVMSEPLYKMQNSHGQSTEVDALNSILNNINVQTKNTVGGGGCLPPI